jgi:hypothetical protein
VQRRQAQAWADGKPYDVIKAEMAGLHEEGKKLSEEMMELNTRVRKAEEENKGKIKK